jgi:hypothetical protein
MYYRVDIIDQYMRFAEAVKIFYFANKCPGLFSLYMKYPSAGEKPAGGRYKPGYALSSKKLICFT